MNRQPSVSDCMRKVARHEFCDDARCYWHQHQRTCGRDIPMDTPVIIVDEDNDTEPDGDDENIESDSSSNEKTSLLIQANCVSETKCLTTEFPICSAS